MPSTRAQIRRARVIGHTVDFGDGVEVKFWYDRNKVTDAWMEDWTEQEEQANAPRMNEMLADLIERWDLLEEEDGPVIPVSAKEIGSLFSLPDKLFLMKELLGAGVPTSEEGEVSSGHSSPSPPEGQQDSGRPSQESPQMHPNGGEPSPSPAPSTSPSPT